MTQDPSPTVRVQAHDGWGELILSRPARKNALIGPMASELRAGLAALMAGGARAIVLRGDGGVFCSGLDVDAFAEDPAPDWRAGWSQEWAGWHLDLFHCRAVIICALERYAINAGASMALAADLLIAGETSSLLIGEAALGMHAPMNLAWLRLRTHEAIAAQLALGARRTSAADLLRLGLAYEVVADDDVAPRALALAAQLAGYPGQGLAAIKTALRKPAPEGGDAVFAAVQATGLATAAPARISP